VITFACKCGKEITTGDYNVGNLIQCPHCFKRVMVSAQEVSTDTPVEGLPDVTGENFGSPDNCPRCAAPVAAGAETCPKCGHPIGLAGADDAQELVRRRRQRHWGAKLIIGGLAFVVICALLQVGWRYISPALPGPTWIFEIVQYSLWFALIAGWLAMARGGSHIAVWRGYPALIGLLFGLSVVGLVIVILLPRRNI